jgi:hypothetical protein
VDKMFPQTKPLTPLSLEYLLFHNHEHHKLIVVCPLAAPKITNYNLHDMNQFVKSKYQGYQP